MVTINILSYNLQADVFFLRRYKALQAHALNLEQVQ